MLKGNKIILASSSRSRRKILNSAGVQYRSIKPFVDEESLKKGFKGSTRKLALMLAEKKALSVSKNIKIQSLLVLTKFYPLKEKFLINQKQ